MNRNNSLVLSLGIIIGIIATSLYWNRRQERSKFMFDQNLRCQQLAKQYENDRTSVRSIVSVLKVSYAPSRNSCLAEITRLEGDGDDVATVEDILSGELLFQGRSKIKQGDDLEKLLKEQDAKFDAFSR
jgi:hypothetical protein